MQYATKANLIEVLFFFLFEKEGESRAGGEAGKGEREY